MSKATPSLTRELLQGPKTGTELGQILNLSQSSFSRLFHSASATENVRAFGKRKGVIYGAPRKVAGIGPTFPIFRIDETGRCHPFGDLTAVESRGFILEPLVGAPEIFPGVPFFLSDARPQGYLGRAFGHRHADLGFPKRLADWSEDQVFASLALRGEHIPGNFIVGNESFDRYQRERKATGIPIKDRAAEYELRVAKSLEGDLPGSSAAGEQPKFPAYLEDERHVLVKFSPPLTTAKGRRWGDLLIAEALALETLRDDLGVATARTEVISTKNRVFLESTRFDRVGPRGRKGCLTFASLELEWLGSPSVWAASAKAMLQARKISKSDAAAIQLVDAFGAWIANTDRHYGNLSFFYEPGESVAKLAPIYDMLPMFYAPKDSEDATFEREWTPPTPHPDTLLVWDRAREAAAKFWAKVAVRSEISADFRKIAKDVVEHGLGDPR